jgi:hypothetical protein
MHHTLGRIRDKPTDYKLCKECYSVNWYKNEFCVNCNSEEFDEEADVREYIQEDIDYYISEEEFNEENAENLEVEV